MLYIPLIEKKIYRKNALYTILEKRLYLSPLLCCKYHYPKNALNTNTWKNGLYITTTRKNALYTTTWKKASYIPLQLDKTLYHHYSIKRFKYNSHWKSNICIIFIASLQNFSFHIGYWKINQMNGKETHPATNECEPQPTNREE